MAAYPTPQISALFPRGIPDPYLREFEIRRQLRDAGIPGLNFNQNDTRYPAMQSLLYVRPQQELDRQDLRLRGRGRGHRRGRSEGDGEGRRGDHRSHSRAHSHDPSSGHGQGQHPRQRAVSDICRESSSKGLESGSGHFYSYGPCVSSRESGGRTTTNDSNRLAIPGGDSDFAAPSPSPVPTPFHRRYRSAEHVVLRQEEEPHREAHRSHLQQTRPHPHPHPHPQQSQSQQTSQQPGTHPRQRPQAQVQVKPQPQPQAQPQPLIRVHDGDSNSNGDGDSDEGEEGTMTELVAPPPSYEEATMGSMDVGSMRRERMPRGVTVQANMDRDGNMNRSSRSQVIPERRVPLLQVLVV